MQYFFGWLKLCVWLNCDTNNDMVSVYYQDGSKLIEVSMLFLVTLFVNDATGMITDAVKMHLLHREVTCEAEKIEVDEMCQMLEDNMRESVEMWLAKLQADNE